MRELLVEVSGSTGLDYAHNFPYRALRGNRYEYMDMVCFTINFFDYEVGMKLSEAFDGFLEVGQYALIQCVTSVFGRPHQVVVTQEN